jgi:hypothetical protein
MALLNYLLFGFFYVEASMAAFYLISIGHRTYLNNMPAGCENEKTPL